MKFNKNKTLYDDCIKFKKEWAHKQFAEGDCWPAFSQLLKEHSECKNCPIKLALEDDINIFIR